MRLIHTEKRILYIQVVIKPWGYYTAYGADPWLICEIKFKLILIPTALDIGMGCNTTWN